MDYSVLYRGQGKYYSECMPSIFRVNRSEEDLFAEWVKVAEFELMLKQFEITHKFEANRFIIDYVGLAQHYGLKTNALDLTCSLNVALFFAMCDYDNLNDCYIPKAYDNNYIGYIYATLVIDDSKGINAFSDNIKPIGMQPFRRPGSQKAFSKLFSVEDQMNGYLYSFSFTKKDSEMIYSLFSKGEDLWSRDQISEIAKEIRYTTIFSNQAISLAAKKYGKGISAKKWTKKLLSKGYRIQSLSNQPWSRIGKNVTDNEWNVTIDDIVCRNQKCADRNCSELDINILGQIIFFNMMNSGYDSPADYDSGICFLQEEHNGHPVYGIEWNASHRPVSPDLKGIICSVWKENQKDFHLSKSFHLPDSFKMKKVWVPNSNDI